MPHDPLLIKKNIRIEDLYEVSSASVNINACNFTTYNGPVLMLKSQVDKLNDVTKSKRKRVREGKRSSAWEGKSEYYLILSNNTATKIICTPKAIKEHIETTWPKLDVKRNKRDKVREMYRLYEEEGHLMLYHLKILKNHLSKRLKDQAAENDNLVVANGPEEKRFVQLNCVPKDRDTLEQKIKKHEENKLKPVQEMAELRSNKLALESPPQDERSEYELAPCKKVQKEGEFFNDKSIIDSPRSYKSVSYFLRNDNAIKDQVGAQSEFFSKDTPEKQHLSNSTPKIEPFWDDFGFFSNFEVANKPDEAAEKQSIIKTMRNENGS